MPLHRGQQHAKIKPPQSREDDHAEGGYRLWPGKNVPKACGGGGQMSEYASGRITQIRHVLLGPNLTLFLRMASTTNTGAFLTVFGRFGPKLGFVFEGA